MADKFEREIEEILAKLDGDGPLRTETGAKQPISITSARRKPPKPKPARAPGQPGLFSRISPSTLLFAGAGTMIAGLILSNIYSPLIWASFAGVVLFLGAFLWSFRRTNRSAGAAAPQGHYWRDRYIEYEPSNSSAFGRLTRRFRRR